MTVQTRLPLRERAQLVTDVVARNADAVDREGRFPVESVEALKAHRLLGAMVPVALGGEGATMREIAEVCAVLGQGCSSTAMIFAMHQIKLSSLIAHGVGSAWHQDFMRRIVARQLLLGSATTEKGIGGDLRSSICAVQVTDGRVRLTKDATVISYGSFADAILVTARSGPEAAASDQVLVAFERGQYTLEKTGTWDALGMRGTCSDGFVFSGEGAAEQILPKPFAEIAAQSMLAHSHLLWSSLWYGITAAAVGRAQAFVKAEARRQTNGAPPPGAIRLAEVVSRLNAMKAVVADGIRRYEHATQEGREDQLNSMSFAVAMNNVKVSASEAAADIVHRVLMICGIHGYKNDTPYSVGRHLRDVLSAAVMINNDRIYGNTSNLLLVHKIDTSIFGAP